MGNSMMKLLDFEHLSAHLSSYGAWGPLALIAAYILVSLVLFPATILTLVGGAIYGPWFGTLYVTLGANLGASAAFFLARLFGFGFAKKILDRHFPNVEQQIADNGFLWTFTLRLLPVTPFVLFNYAAGLTPVKWVDFMLGSLLGMLPMTFLYVTLGSTLGALATPNKIDWTNPKTWLPFTIAVLSAGVVFCLKKRLKIRSQTSASHVSDLTHRE